MALLTVIRRWAFRDGMSIREITRRTGLSRNTIRKYLRSDAVEPKFRVGGRVIKLDPFAELLSGWLRAEPARSRKQRRTGRQIHADLVVLGYDGSYSRVAAFIRAGKADRQVQEQTTGRGTFVPLVFMPGEAFQFDWSEDWAILGGERVKLQAAHTKLSHSRAFIVRAYPLQTHEMLFDAHLHAFRVLGGVRHRPGERGCGPDFIQHRCTASGRRRPRLWAAEQGGNRRGQGSASRRAHDQTVRAIGDGRGQSSLNTDAVAAAPQG